MYNKNFKCSAIIIAAGNSRRMKELGNKQFITLFDRSILSYSISSFERCDLVDEIIVVVRKEDILYCKKSIIKPNLFSKVKKVIAGGDERQHSVFNGLHQIDKDTKYVIIHDGARPIIDDSDIERIIFECLKYNAVSFGVKVKDTIKFIDDDSYVVSTPKRSSMWITQTPQAFKYDLIMNAHIKATENNFIGTDDSVLIEKLGHKVKMIEGSYRNIKITTQEDLKIAKIFLEDLNK